MLHKLAWAGAGLAAAIVTANALVADDTKAKVPEQERELVRQVHQARDNYQAHLERLRTYYLNMENKEQLYWVDRELTDYHLGTKYPYLLDMDLPSADLKPDTSLPKANRIFQEALGWLDKKTLREQGENYKRAELLFQRLIRDYPRSDKLDEACYYLGQIYASRYFEQYRRSVAYYERVWLYEPNTNLDARIRAAQIYDRNLLQRTKAIELYQEVLRREVDPKQTETARRRLEALLGTRGN